MKILYIANERSAAKQAAHALRGIAPNITLTWAHTLGSALRWLQGNPDAAVIICAAEVQSQPGASFVEQVRRLGLTTPVVIQSLQADLPHLVISALQRTPAAATTTRESVATIQGTRDDASLARANKICTALQQRLLELEAALRDADERHSSEAAAAADHLALRHAEFTAGLAQAAEWRDVLAQKLNMAMAALDEERHARTADAAATADQLARREAELLASLTEAVAARTALEDVFMEAQAAHRDAQQRAAADLAAAVERHASLESRLNQEATTRRSLEQNLAAVEAAREDADDRYGTELATVAMNLADVQGRYDAALTEHAAVRTALELQLTDAAAALERVREERASEAAAAADHLARREAELLASLTEAVAARAAREHTFTEAQAAHQHAQQRAAADLAAASQREGELVERLDHESAARTTLERDLAERRVKAAHTRRRFLEVASAFRQRTREHKARLEAQLTCERVDSERLLTARDEEIRRIQREREALQHLLDTTQEQLQHLHSAIIEERQGYERARLTSDSELQQLSAEYDRVRQSLNQVQTAVHTLEHVAGEHAIERAGLESVVVDRDSQLSTQAARHQAAEQAAEHALAQIQEKLRSTVEVSSRDIARLQRKTDAVRQELEATRAQAQALRAEAERVPVLQMQLEEGQKENLLQFERAPYGLCRCTQDGTITHVNHSLVKLLGYGHAADLHRVDFAANVFECAGDFRWLIERSMSTGTSESVETTLKTRDRRRLHVRLHALTTTHGWLEIAVEDMTNLRAVEERLRQAQRMEAVGRLASEVAVNCDTLLRDAAQDGQQWLTAIESDTPLRQQGELLLGEVTRAANFLRQFADYGNEQVHALEPVSVQRVLRDLEPVLQRVAGDDIELVLPKTSAPVDVDVEAERVERVLVNVASYARERMPDGGRVKIDLATTVVDRKFIATYPNVRPGAHVLITVTEVRAPGRPRWSTAPRAEQAAGGASPSASDKPGVDLGALMRLVGNCGGHLWMAAEPSGNMTLKIHLPKRAADDTTDSAASGARSNRGRQLARWFRH